MLRLTGGGPAARSARGTIAAEPFCKIRSPRQEAGRILNGYEGRCRGTEATTGTSPRRSRDATRRNDESDRADRGNRTPEFGRREESETDRPSDCSELIGSVRPATKVSVSLAPARKLARER